MLKVDLDRGYAVRAFEACIASLKRSEKATFNPAMKQIIQQDIQLYQSAINTITETK